MDLQVIATGSSGNCYALHAGREILLLDAGLPGPKIMRAIGSRSRDVVGCLVTHEHQDHCKGVPWLAERGIPCLGTLGTQDVVEGITALRQGDIGGFRVKRVPVLHDAIDPCGWLILHRATGEKMIYATDTCWLPNTPGLHYWLVECNYCDDLLEPGELSRRLETSHMSLDKLCTLLAQNDLSQCKKIVLCHISQARGDYQRMQRRVQEVTGIPVEIAKAGVTIPLELEPF